MSTQDLVRPAVGVEQAEAALVEHYPRLVRMAYLVLPPSLGRNRRVLTAHSVVQRSLPRGRAGRGSEGSAGVPVPRGTAAPGYAYIRGRVLRQALEAGLPLRRWAWPKRGQFPPLLPQVWGLRVFPAPAAPMNSPWTSGCPRCPVRHAPRTCCAVSNGCRTRRCGTS